MAKYCQQMDASCNVADPVKLRSGSARDIPLAAFLSELFVACLDLNGLWEAFVVGR